MASVHILRPNVRLHPAIEAQLSGMPVAVRTWTLDHVVEANEHFAARERNAPEEPPRASFGMNWRPTLLFSDEPIPYGGRWHWGRKARESDPDRFAFWWHTTELAKLAAMALHERYETNLNSIQQHHPRGTGYAGSAKERERFEAFTYGLFLAWRGASQRYASVASVVWVLTE